MRRSIPILCALFCACGEPTAPAPSRVTLAVVGSDVIYAAADAPLPEPLQVMAVDAAAHVPVRNVTVEWRVIQGAVSLTAPTSTTNEYGVAATTPTVGALGTYRVRATSDRIVGTAPVMEIRVVPPPVITAITPAAITAGDTITVTGSNFSTTAADNAVLFDGVRGRVVSATVSQLRVIVPHCLPARQVNVRVALGFVSSSPVTTSAAAVSGTALELLPGQSRTFGDPVELACMRLPGGMASAIYLVVPHNVGEALSAPQRFELNGLTRQAPITTFVDGPVTPSDFAWQWEQSLRARERAFPAGPPTSAIIAAPPLPKIGDRRDFNVLDPDNRFVKITAAARVVTPRAILYVDTEAQSAFTNADLVRLGELFDDPIYPTNVQVFGAVSDIDGNERVMILFTPRVNALTPRHDASFIAGYFYGCDLVSKSRCSGTNNGEVFYSLVPDPAGTWSSPRSAAQVLAAIPPVLAHELQHMIHFARRGFSTDALWLSEALAQTAEEIVGDVFLARGETALAAAMKNGNLSRAHFYLSAPQRISLLAQEPPGSLEQRGGVWLFLKYLRGHYGQHDLLRRLTSSTRTGTGNVTAETGQPWSRLLTDFGVAIWADGAPDMRGPLEPHHTFVDFNLRAAMDARGGMPLRPLVLGWRDFSVGGSLPTASQNYFALVAPNDASAPPLNFVFSAPLGAAFGSDARVQLSILRVR